MADVLAEYRRVESAYDQPTLALLGKDTAKASLAIFRTLFSRESPAVPGARLFDQVEDLLGILRLAGHPTQMGTGRDLSLRWVRDQWLTRKTNDDGAEVFELTSHTLEALRLVDSLTRERAANLSEHRIATIMNHLRRFNAEVNPDRGERVRILNTQIDQLAAERDRLLDGGEMVAVTDDHLLEGYTEALQLLAGLPGDFSRVVEAFVRFRSSTIEAFNAEAVTTGEVVDSYLSHTDEMMRSTPEGRAFEGAFALLRDDEQVDRLRSDIEALVAHPRAADILTHADRVELRSAGVMIGDGVARVLDSRTRVSGALRDYISRQDVSRDRELSSVLQALEGELTGWMKTAGPRAKAPAELLTESEKLKVWRERYYDPADDVVPAPVKPPPADPTPAPSLEELRQRGGPSHELLHEHLAAALQEFVAGYRADGADAEMVVTLAEVFNSLPADLRRPVEVFGMLPLTHTHGLEPTGAVEVVETIRPDGSRRHLEVPQYRAPIPADPAGDPGADTPTDSDSAASVQPKDRPEEHQ